MGYGDYIPSGGQHHKKPLTKGQIRKLQKAYAKSGAITESVKEIEKEEQIHTQKEIEKDLSLLF